MQGWTGESPHPQPDSAFSRFLGPPCSFNTLSASHSNTPNPVITIYEKGDLNLGSLHLQVRAENHRFCPSLRAANTPLPDSRPGSRSPVEETSPASPPCTPPPPAGTGRAPRVLFGEEEPKTRSGPFPSNSTFLFYFFKAIRVSISTAEPFPIVKIKRKCTLPPFIFSRFQCGKQIHALKYLVLVGRVGGGGSFLLIKNKLCPAPSRSACAGPSSLSATHGYRGPWDPRGHCGHVAEPPRSADTAKPRRAQPRPPTIGVTQTFVSL